MRIALPNQASTNLTRIAGRLSFAVSAGLIAVAAIAGSGVLAEKEQTVTASPVRPISADFTYSPAPATYPPMTYFLVDSISQYDLVVAEQTALADAGASQGEEHWFSVFLADTPALATDAWDQIQQAKVEWLRCCPTVRLQVIDLRQPKQGRSDH
jgi:hypothetical protein